MARIAVCEPSSELKLLFERAVSRLGHEAVPCCPRTVGELPADVDALLLDCDPDESVGPAGQLRRRRPDLPIVTCSIYSASPPVRGLGAVAHLTKPFTRAELDQALEKALAELALPPA